MNKEQEIYRLVKELEKSGVILEIKKNCKYKKHTFEVDEKVLNEFFKAQKDKKMKIKDAINDALICWIEKR